VARSTVIAVLMPGLIAGSGGIRTILSQVRALVADGYEVHVHVEPFGLRGGRRSSDSLQARADRLFGETGATYHTGLTPDPSCDLVIATKWSTAARVAALPPRTAKAYLIQDFEPAFYPVGDDYLRAEASYRLGLVPIVLGRWLARALHERYGTAAHRMDFGVDLSTYRPPVSNWQKPTVCFIYQPDKPRRCAGLGADVLARVARVRPDVRIATFGYAGRPDWPFPVDHRGVLSPAGCAELYRRSTVGLCLSPTNPSRIPFEMMASGLPLVELHGANTVHDLPSAGTVLASPHPAGLADAVLALLEDGDWRRRLSEGGRAFAADRPAEIESRGFLAAVGAILDGRPPPGDASGPCYDRPAFRSGAGGGDHPQPSDPPTPAQRVAGRLRRAGRVLMRGG
jgi:O-antigen biosynthesis protein